jgi:hypothetical protein
MRGIVTEAMVEQGPINNLGYLCARAALVILTILNRAIQRILGETAKMSLEMPKSLNSTTPVDGTRTPIFQALLIGAGVSHVSDVLTWPNLMDTLSVVRGCGHVTVAPGVGAATLHRRWFIPSLRSTTSSRPRQRQLMAMTWWTWWRQTWRR